MSRFYGHPIKMKSAVALTALICVSAFAGQPQTNLTAKIETPAQHAARMAWWREAKFGMFIHWGVYSVPAGTYHGKPVPGLGEWIMNDGKIPMAEYQKFAQKFNPVKYNPDDWVKVAQAAGIKYLVITAKHHDGFANFSTQASAWNIVDATPYGQDVLPPLAAACRKYGIPLGFYYSQAQDWNNGGAAWFGKWDPRQEHDMDDYIDKVAVPQVRELCSNYGEFPAVIWWDSPKDMTYPRAKKIYDTVEQLRPNIILNNRLGGGFPGDTETPEQVIPPQGFPGRDWETCMTINDTWGFKKDDNNWKPTETLICNLCDIASKGGNYLLNVGPTSEGLIPQPSLERLAEIGKWMKVNGEAIYGTGPTPFGAEAGKFSNTQKSKRGKKKGQSQFIPSWDWRATTKPGKIYLEIFKWPADGKFNVPGLQSQVREAYLLAGHKQIKFQQQANGVSLTLPEKAPDAIASVACLEIADATAKVAGK